MSGRAPFVPPPSSGATPQQEAAYLETVARVEAPHGAPPRGQPAAISDTVTLTVGNQQLVGWQRVSVRRPLAAIPADFDLEVTERYPNTSDINVQPGQPCTIQIGGDLVITGYVDRYQATISAGTHSIRISGRSKSEDLVDCSAVFGDVNQPGFQVINGTTLAIVEQLAAPYNVPVKTMAGDGVTIPQFNILLGETPWEIIDRITRYSQMLVYDLPDGSIMLANVGKQSMASGFSIGDNVEQAGVAFSMDGRFSEYEGHLTSVLTFGTDGGVNTPGVGEVIKDDGVPRFRKRYVISEQFVEGEPIVKKRAVWEMNKRKGQSYQFTVTCDSWRDSAGKLWEPNMLAPIQAAALKLTNASYIIASVSYLRDESGQHGQLVLMPPEAFFVEPAGPLGPTTKEDVENFNATKPAGGAAADPNAMGAAPVIAT
jgi:prophage tail gpP-like protein